MPEFRDAFGRPPRRRAGAAVIACGLPLAAAVGQCEPTWSNVGGGTTLGLIPLVYDTCVWDDGTGESLYASGIFELAGTTPVLNVARWDGESWHDVGGGIARGGAPAIGVCLQPHDDGSGEALYLGGLFTTAGGAVANYIARWDGAQWSGVGGGMSGNVWGLVEWDADGRGPNPPRLYATGEFTLAGSTPASRAAVWDGARWSALGSGLEHGGQSFLAGYTAEAVGGGVLFGGIFGLAGGVPVKGLAKWDGAAWSALGPDLDNPGFNTSVGDITVFDAGNGPEVYVAGSFISSQGVTLNRVARFDGSAWQPLGTGLSGGGGSSFAEWDGGLGRSLWVGGTFMSAGGGQSAKLARWDGQAWHDVGFGLSGGGIFVEAVALTPWRDGGGEALYVAGGFDFAGTLPVHNIARLAACPVVCYPDCDTSTGVGVLDIFDFLCFQNRYAAGTPYACDCDTDTGPGVCDIFDFLCFQNEYVVGCP